MTPVVACGAQSGSLWGGSWLGAAEPTPKQVQMLEEWQGPKSCVLLLLLLAFITCWPAVLVQKRGHIFGQAPPTMLIYANCTATISTAQDNRTSFLAIHPCLNDMKAHTLPALSFKHHKKPLQSSCVLPCPCFLSHFHSLMAPLFLDVPYKVPKRSHQSVSWTPCLAPAFPMLVSQASVLFLALLSLSTVSVSYCQDAYTSQFSLSSQIFFLLWSLLRVF